MTGQNRQARELAEKLSDLIESRFDGDPRAAFDHYSKGSGRMDAGQLEQLLKHAHVGNFATRGVWARGIMHELDGDRDGYISWEDFGDEVERHGPPAGAPVEPTS